MPYYSIEELNELKKLDEVILLSLTNLRKKAIEREQVDIQELAEEMLLLHSIAQKVQVKALKSSLYSFITIFSCAPGKVKLLRFMMNKILTMNLAEALERMIEDED